MPNLSAFPTEVAACIQDGILEDYFRWGIQGELTYGQFAGKEIIGANIGEKITFTRAGLRTPKTTPTTAAAINSNLNNGMTTSTSPVEQFSLTLHQYDDMESVNVFQKNVGVKDLAMKAAKTLGIQAAQSRDRLARNEVVHTYMGGNTRVISGGTLSTTTCRVDDIEGFTELLNASGQVVAPSNSNKLSVRHYDSSGALVQTLLVTNFSVDGSNASTVYMGNDMVGRSGQLVFDSATQPTVGDTLVAVTAYRTLRPNGKLNTSNLTTGDWATLSLILDAVTKLRNNKVPTINGKYNVVLTPTSERQLMADPDFKSYFSALSKEVQEAGIYEILDCRFIRSTEAPYQPAGNGLTPDIHRIVVLGEDAFVEADWKGIDKWLQEGYVNDLIYVVREGPIIMTVRAPMDLHGQIVDFGWLLVTGFACGTDLHADRRIIPTANNGVLHKRAYIIEHGAAAES